MKELSWTTLLLMTSVGAGVYQADFDEAALERGRYLAHDVSQCVQCHTPRTPDGRLDETRLFMGAPIPVNSPFFNDQWAFQAPALAGLPGWSREDVSWLLQTGHRRDGRRPLSPMPSFRMRAVDADAVAAYLSSLR